MEKDVVSSLGRYEQDEGRYDGEAGHEPEQTEDTIIYEPDEKAVQLSLQILRLRW